MASSHRRCGRDKTVFQRCEHNWRPDKTVLCRRVGGVNKPLSAPLGRRIPVAIGISTEQYWIADSLFLAALSTLVLKLSFSQSLSLHSYLSVPQADLLESWPMHSLFGSHWRCTFNRAGVLAHFGLTYLLTYLFTCYCPVMVAADNAAATNTWV